jgi:hypothetical protein
MEETISQETAGSSEQAVVSGNTENTGTQDATAESSTASVGAQTADTGAGGQRVPIERLNQVIEQRKEWERKYNEATQGGGGYAAREQKAGAERFFDDETDKALRQFVGENVSPQVQALESEFQRMKLERLNDDLRKLDGWDKHAEDVIRKSTEIINEKTGEIDFLELGRVLLQATRVDTGEVGQEAAAQANRLNEDKARGVNTTGASGDTGPAKDKSWVEMTLSERDAARAKNRQRQRG